MNEADFQTLMKTNCRKHWLPSGAAHMISHQLPRTCPKMILLAPRK